MNPNNNLAFDYSKLRDDLTNINKRSDILREMLVTDENKIITLISFWKNEKLESSNISPEYQAFCNERITILKQILIQKETLTAHLLELKQTNLQLPSEKTNIVVSTDNNQKETFLTLTEIIKKLKEGIWNKDENIINEAKDMMKKGNYITFDENGKESKGTPMLPNTIESYERDCRESVTEEFERVNQMEQDRKESENVSEPLFNYDKHYQEKIKAFAQDPDNKKLAKSTKRSDLNAKAMNFFKNLFPKDQNPFKVKDAYNFVTWMFQGCPNEEWHLYKEAERTARKNLEKAKINVPTSEPSSNSETTSIKSNIEYTTDDIPKEVKDMVITSLKENNSIKGKSELIRETLHKAGLPLRVLAKFVNQTRVELKLPIPEKNVEVKPTEISTPSDPTGTNSAGKQEENVNSQDTQQEVGTPNVKEEEKKIVTTDSSKVPSTDTESTSLSEELKEFIKKCFNEGLSLNKTQKAIKAEKLEVKENKPIRTFYHTLQQIGKITDTVAEEKDPTTDSVQSSQESAPETSGSQSVEDGKETTNAEVASTTTTESEPVTETQEETTGTAPTTSEEKSEEKVEDNNVPWKEGDEDPTTDQTGSNQNEKTGKTDSTLYVEVDIETESPEVYEKVKDITSIDDLKPILEEKMKEGNWKTCINILRKLVFHNKQIVGMENMSVSQIDDWYANNIVKKPTPTFKPLNQGPGPKVATHIPKEENSSLEKIKTVKSKDEFKQVLTNYFKEKGFKGAGVPQSAKAAVVKAIKHCDKTSYSNKYKNSKDGDIYKVLIPIEYDCFPEIRSKKEQTQTVAEPVTA